jgi:hypothetical protein
MTAHQTTGISEIQTGLENAAFGGGFTARVESGPKDGGSGICRHQAELGLEDFYRDQRNR